MAEGSPSPARRGRRPFLRGCAVILASLAGFFLLLGVVSRLTGLSLPGGGKVGIVPITGLIADSESTIAQIRKFAKDDSIKAIVLRINSPGGGVGPSQEIQVEFVRLLAQEVCYRDLGHPADPVSISRPRGQ